MDSMTQFKMDHPCGKWVDIFDDLYVSITSSDELTREKLWHSFAGVREECVNMMRARIEAEERVEELEEELQSRRDQVERLSFDAQLAINECQQEAEALCDDMIGKITIECCRRKTMESKVCHLTEQNERLLLAGNLNSRAESRKGTINDTRKPLAGQEKTNGVDVAAVSATLSGYALDDQAIPLCSRQPEHEVRDTPGSPEARRTEEESDGALQAKAKDKELNVLTARFQMALRDLEELKLQRSVELRAVEGVLSSFDDRLLALYRRSKDLARLHMAEFKRAESLAEKNEALRRRVDMLSVKQSS